MGFSVLNAITSALSLAGALGLAFSAVNVLNWKSGSPRTGLYTRLWDTFSLALVALVLGTISTVLLLLVVGRL